MNQINWPDFSRPTDGCKKKARRNKPFDGRCADCRSVDVEMVTASAFADLAILRVRSIAPQIVREPTGTRLHATGQRVDDVKAIDILNA